MMMKDWLGAEKNLCEHCALTICCCPLVKLEEKIRQIREEKESQRKTSSDDNRVKIGEGRKRGRSPSPAHREQETPSKRSKEIKGLEH